MKLINRIKETWTAWNSEPTIEESLNAVRPFLNTGHVHTTYSYEDGLLKAHIYTIDGQTEDVSWKYNSAFSRTDNITYFFRLVHSAYNDMMDKMYPSAE